FRARELVYLDQRLVHHLRSFSIDTEGLPDDPLGVEFSVKLLGLYTQQGRPVMLTRNTVSGLNYAYAKIGGPASASASAAASGAAPGPAQSPAPFQQPQPGTPSAAARTLDGVWQRQDGVILIAQGNQFQV